MTPNPNTTLPDMFRRFADLTQFWYRHTASSELAQREFQEYARLLTDIPCQIERLTAFADLGAGQLADRYAAATKPDDGQSPEDTGECPCCGGLLKRNDIGIVCLACDWTGTEPPNMPQNQGKRDGEAAKPLNEPNLKAPGVRECHRTGQYFPQINGKDLPLTTFDVDHAWAIAREAAARP